MRVTRQRGPVRNLTVILKATNVCNAACRFCAIGLSGRDRMTWASFERLANELERVVEQRSLDGLGVTFHGGEPTTLGADWIDRACERLQRIPTQVRLSMQSNLVSISDRMIDVFHRHQIQVGSSFDPLFGQRVDRDGNDSFPRWVESYTKLSRSGLQVGAIFVVTKEAVKQAERLYDRCESLRSDGWRPIGIQLNPVYPQGRASEGTRFQLRPEEFGNFLIDFWKTWEKRGRSVRVTPIQGFVDWFEAGSEERPLLSCTFGGDCSDTHVGVDHALNVAGCGRRLDSHAMLGNLHDQNLHELLLHSEESRRIAHRSDRLRDGPCRGCRFFGLCHGGCPDDAELASGDLEECHPWCLSYRMLFEQLEARPNSRIRNSGTQKGTAPQRRLQLALGDEDEGVLADGSPGLETWVLPSRDGRALEFDSGLERALAPGVGGVRLWVHNRHAGSLVLWRDLLRSRRMRVELFEADDDLETALNTANALGVAVGLDIESIGGAAGGFTRLRGALERYLCDPLWKVPIHPFDEMLRLAIAGGGAAAVGRWGLPDGFVLGRVADAGSVLDPFARQLQVALERESRKPVPLPDAKGPCVACEAGSICAGRLLAADRSTCESRTRDLARRITEVARRVNDDLNRPTLEATH